MRFFGASKSAPAKKEENVKNGVLKMKETLEMLGKREAMLTARMDKELRVAKENAQKNKTVALQALKRKKAIESQLLQVEQMRFNLETQLGQIEAASMNREVLDSMLAGASTLKTLHGGLDSVKVEDTMDEIQEQMSVAQDLSAALTRPFDSQYIDEDDLMQELDDLENEGLAQELLDVEPTVSLPAAPTHEPIIAGKASAGKAKQKTLAEQEEDELAELQREMMV